MPFWGWLSDHLERLSDLQLGNQKVTLNHLAPCNFQSQATKKKMAAKIKLTRKQPQHAHMAHLKISEKWRQLLFWRAVFWRAPRKNGWKQQKKGKCVCKCSIVNQVTFYQVLFPITFSWFWNYGKFPILNATQSGGWHIHLNDVTIVWTDSSITPDFGHDKGWSHPANSTNGNCRTWSLLQRPGQKLF